jgi:hypothetical protein
MAWRQDADQEEWGCAMTDHDLARIKRMQRSTERERFAQTIDASEPAAPSPPPPPLPYRLPGPPSFKFRDEAPVERDPDKVPYDFYASHPEWKPRPIRGRRAKWRTIREGY